MVRCRLQEGKTISKPSGLAFMLPSFINYRKLRKCNQSLIERMEDYQHKGDVVLKG